MIKFLSAILIAATLAIAPLKSANSAIQPLKSQVDGRVFCTAFHINDVKNYWMTAHHCIMDGKEVREPLVGDSGEPAKLVAGFPDIDVAILESDIGAVPLKLSATAPRLGSHEAKGSPVHVIGFGYGFDPPTIFWGFVSNIIQVEGRKYLLFDMAVWPGHSGSPVMNSTTGDVVSVAQVVIDPGGIAGGVTWEDLVKRTAKYWATK